MRDELVSSPDGRWVAYCVVGVDDPGAPTVVYCHGAPSSRYELVNEERAIVEVGARVVALDRPGYGRSTPLVPRAIHDHVADVELITKQESIQRFSAVGVSSGAPYALACGALLPSQVEAVAVVAGVTDFAWQDSWTDYDELECQVMRQPSADAAIAWCQQQFGEDGRGLLVALSDNPDSAPDPAFAEAFRQGIVGYAYDVWLQARPWAFDVTTIHVPTIVCHGDADTTIPIGHGLRTASLIPQAQFEAMPCLDHVAACAQVPSIVARMARSQTLLNAGYPFVQD